MSFEAAWLIDAAAGVGATLGAVETGSGSGMYWVGADAGMLKFHRSRVLTADDPAAVRRHLAEAFAAFESVHASEKKAA